MDNLCFLTTVTTIFFSSFFLPQFLLSLSFSIFFLYFLSLSTFLKLSLCHEAVNCSHERDMIRNSHIHSSRTRKENTPKTTIKQNVSSLSHSLTLSLSHFWFLRSEIQKRFVTTPEFRDRSKLIQMMCDLLNWNDSHVITFFFHLLSFSLSLYLPLLLTTPKDNLELLFSRKVLSINLNLRADSM